MGGLVAPRTIRGPRLYNRIQVNSISGDLIGLFCSFRNMLETKEPISLERTQSDDVSHPIGQGFNSGLRKKNYNSEYKQYYRAVHNMEDRLKQRQR